MRRSQAHTQGLWEPKVRVSARMRLSIADAAEIKEDGNLQVCQKDSHSDLRGEKFNRTQKGKEWSR